MHYSMDVRIIIVCLACRAVIHSEGEIAVGYVGKFPRLMSSGRQDVLREKNQANVVGKTNKRVLPNQSGQIVMWS